MVGTSRMINLLILAISSVGLLTGAASEPVVRLNSTNITGSQFGKVEFFGGVPYAEPPLGPLRLNFPVLSTSIDAKDFDARQSGPGCLQTPSPPSGISEDCLTIDIYRPAGIAPDAKLPILFWIYGGGFIVGASSFYNGTSIVTRSIDRGTPIIFISVNYRLGPLGFPQGFEAGQRKILNLGLHDQLIALEWIQNNIHNFGGDKSKVTLQGESAGALSIQVFFLQSKIKSLARAAILESGGSEPTYGPQRNEANWQEYIAAIPSCSSFAGSNDTLDCVRLASSSSLAQAIINTNAGFSNGSFFPVIDGPGGLIVDRPSRINAMGYLPLLHGANLDEGTIVTAQNINSTSQVRDMIEAFISPPLLGPVQFNDDLTEMLQSYPDIAALGSPFGTGNKTFGLSSQYKRYAAIFGDLLLHSSRRTVSQQVSALGLPVFAYHFMDHDAVVFPEFAPVDSAPGSLGVPHSSEIPYVFGTLVNKTPNATALSVAMQDYWISFVNSLDPNDAHGANRTEWTQHTPTNPVVLNLDGKGSVVTQDNYRAKQIAFWQNNPDFLHR